jgi:hypothetical protein
VNISPPARAKSPEHIIVFSINHSTNSYQAKGISMKASISLVTTYKTAVLADAERAINIYNHGLYSCVKNPDLDKRARDMFAGGLGLTPAKILEQVEFIGKDYGGVAGRPAALTLAPAIADEIFQKRAQYEQAVTTAQNILSGIPSRNTIEILYRPFVKPLVDKNDRVSRNWLVWGAKFWHHLNPDAFPVEDSRVDDFFILGESPSVDKYMNLLKLFRDFVLAHQAWLPGMWDADAGADEIPCADNKLWDKVFYGLGE